MALQVIRSRITTAPQSDQRLDVAFQNRTARLIANRPLTSAVVGIATTVQRVRTTASCTFTVDGNFAAALAATDNLWTLPSTLVLTASQCAAVLLCVNAAGTASVLVSAVRPGAAATGLRPQDFPEVPEDVAIIGWVTLETNASGAFTGNTTALNAANLTTTYFNGQPVAYLLPLTADQGGAVVLPSQMLPL